MKLGWGSLVVGLVGWSLLTPSAARAHGVEIGHIQAGAIRVYARYDSGESMAGAQVRVYSPEDPQNPWLEGRVDPRGHFYFQPDRSIPGTWEVMIRQAGHGGVITVPVAAEADNRDDQLDVTAEPGSRTLSPLHRGLLMGTTVWGFVGTALFFARRRA
jgi:nickel transport protein